MKKLIFNVKVPDKNDKSIIYEKYDPKKKGPIYEFTDKRANEILGKRTRVTDEPFATEYVEDEINEEEVQAVASAITELAREDNKSIEEVVNEIIEESKGTQPTRKKNKSAKKI